MASTVDVAPIPFESQRTAIAALDDRDLDLLTIFVLLAEPTSRSTWKESAASHGIRRNRRQALAAKDLLPLCNRLLEAGVLEQSYSSSHYIAPPMVALSVLTTAHTRDRLAPLAQAYVRRLDDRLRFYDRGGTLTTQLRLAVIQQQPRTAADVLSRLYARNQRVITEFLIDALGHAPQPTWLATLPDDKWPDYLRCIIERARTTLRPLDPQLITTALETSDKKLRLEAARWLVLHGEGERATAIDGLPRWGKEGIAVLDAFFAGDYALAAERGNLAVAAMKARKYKTLTDIEGPCHALALLVTSSKDPRLAAHLGPLLEAMPSVASVDDDDIIRPLQHAYARLRGEIFDDPAGHWQPLRLLTFIPSLVGLLHLVWLHADDAPPDPYAPPLEVLLEWARLWETRAHQGGFSPVAREFTAIAAAFDGEPSEHLAGAFNPPAPWETALASLEEALATTSIAHESQPTSTARHLVWELDLFDDAFVEIQPRVRESARAKKGRKIAVTRLLDGDEAELLDARDRAVLTTVQHVPHRSRSHFTTRPVLGRRTMVALIGHPRVIGRDGAPLTLERGTPTVVTTHHRGQTRVGLRPIDLVQYDVTFECPAVDRVIVYERPAALGPLISVLDSSQGLAVPEKARDRLARTLTRLSAVASIAVEGDLEVGSETRSADPHPVLQLAWDGEALRVRVRVAPLGPGGPHLYPGTGSASLLAEVDDGDEVHLARCRRDLALETERHRALLDACPLLSGFSDAPLHHFAPTLPDALDVMLELDALGDDVRLEWAAGQTLAHPLRADLRHLTIEVGSSTDWLGVDAALEVDEAVVLGFAELLALPPRTRYVPLGRGRFVALSERLRRHLDSLASLGTLRGQQLRASPMLLPALEQLSTEVEDFTFDAQARERLDTLGTIATWVPRIPRGFGTTLRDYQREGFVWMARLARAGLGACLADDMGLGKTVQTLALLCHRARNGPALVVCPTSVVLNWMAEAERFAPTLRLHLLANAGDRSALLDGLRVRDVVVCSYGLLSTQADALVAKEFATVVFDEAHALKNQATKRARAAVRLRAQFRLALTGTPVENHLGELWSLFRVVVPGLLGSKARFEKTFVGPIGDGDRERTSMLRAIMRPFLLRRTKSQVLDELPPRSEATIRVEPSPRQQAFYEALRRQALDRVSSLSPKKARFQILAEITRLRQAAIDPRLVDDRADAPKGAKIDVLLEHLEQLREQGHRALVFTQFLGSMELVRSRLRASGIEYFDLDGSTPAAERARRIEAFQTGEGDVFVLSLRAGGMGINLTGADYVFHLDPWWNPAVEDQATDRAHRIGQARPVTVYRLVTQGTIEDKIVALHASKRQLADDVLVGLEKAKAPDLEELRRLLEV